MAKKPVLLWRENGRLGGRAPDDFQVVPAAVSERLIRMFMDEKRTVLVLAWDAENENVTVERYTPDD
jgi:hypothetical protein